MTIVSVRAGLGLALASPLVLWLGLPGGGEFWPALGIALVPLLYLTQINSLRYRFFLGFISGLFHFMLQLYWIVIVLGRYGGLPWFFSIPAFLLLSGYMAVYVALFIALAGTFQRRWGMQFTLYFIPILWVGLDWLRSILFSGFPWMDLGYGLWQVPMLIQISDVLGHYFLTFVIVLLNCSIFVVLQRDKWQMKLTHAVVSCGFVMAIVAYGTLRIEQIQRLTDTVEHSSIGIVQGNIDQSRKWSPGVQRETIETYLKLSKTLLEEANSPYLIVWPETALPFFPNRNPLFEHLPQFTKKNSIFFLTGSPWYEVQDYQTKDVDFYNAAFIINPQGDYGDVYFKSHLVPFGEYVPLKRFLPFLAPLVEAVGDFSPGSIAAPLQTGNIRSGVLICFESIFPEIARKWVDNGANVLVNLTNDAWYGKSSAPSQSMAMSVYRAVETRRSLVRSANTGISAFVDPVGRITQSSEIFVTWAKSEEVKLMDLVTVYTRYGYLFGPICLGAAVLLSLIKRRKAQHG